MPVEHDQAVLADAQAAGQLGQVRVQVDPAAARLVVVGGRHRLVDEPGEDVADAALARPRSPTRPGTTPPRTTPHMPGTSASSAPFMMWQVEVPITASIWPGSIARAAGAVTCASTLPTATAIPSGSPVQPAASAVSEPARAPSGASGASSLRR